VSSVSFSLAEPLDRNFFAVPQASRLRVGVVTITHLILLPFCERVKEKKKSGKPRVW
jgi:hypothetical protein